MNTKNVIALGCVSVLFASNSVSIANPKPAKKIKRAALVKLSKQVQVTFLEKANASGFDEKPNPHWLMVPLGGTNSAKQIVSKRSLAHPVYKLQNRSNSLIATSQSSGFTPSLPAYDGDVIVIGEPEDGPTEGTITVTGIKRGNTKVEVWASDGRAGVLAVSVKKKRSRTINVFYVSDSTGRSATSADLNIGSLMSGVNNIWEKQANVHFSIKNSYSITVNNDLGEAVNIANKFFTINSHPQVVNMQPSLRANINVFVIWKGEDTVGRGEYEGNDIVIAPLCPIPSYTNVSIVRALAHEIGHNLGLSLDPYPHHSADPKDLMGSSGLYIRKMEAEKVNNSTNNP